jgi:NADH:ubiquinone oxidoreductase subunit D
MRSRFAAHVRRMKVIAEISTKRVARKMLEHGGVSSDVPQQWPARGPPESAASFRCLLLLG